MSLQKNHAHGSLYVGFMLVIQNHRKDKHFHRERILAKDKYRAEIPSILGIYFNEMGLDAVLTKFLTSHFYVSISEFFTYAHDFLTITSIYIIVLHHISTQDKVLQKGIVRVF